MPQPSTGFHATDPTADPNSHQNDGELTQRRQLTTLVILGATGDLTGRLLLPGLGTLLSTQPERAVAVVGAAKAPMPQARWQALVRRSLAAGGCPDGPAAAIVERTRFEAVDAADGQALTALVARIDGPVVLYFALPPAVTERACAALATTGLPDRVRLALEKPFGSDLVSARALNRTLAGFRDEEQLFRVDHFLGESQVLNLLGLRFANRVFEPLWNAQHIERVEIVADEQLGLEGRAGYYDRAGALVDMIQSHLLIMLTVFAMEEPAAIDATEMRDLMAHTLRATTLWDDPAACSRRARYTAGTVDGRELPDYTAEPGVDPARDTDTLAEVTVRIRSQRWAGVPFTLRSGKALARDRRVIAVHFRPLPHVPQRLGAAAPANLLRIDLAPDRLTLDITTNGGGRDKFALDRTSMTAALGESAIRPYGEILGGILDADPLLSVRGDVAEECWRVVDPVRSAWRDGRVPLAEYPAGSDGPPEWNA